MGTRDTFSGGGSIMRGGKDGRLQWTSQDPAENRTSPRSFKRPGNRAPSRGEIEQRSQEANRREAKMIRSFISQCATAYSAGKLDSSHPEPPKFLKSRIKNAGGNVAWLGTQSDYPSLFHRFYCRVLGREIAIDQVWAQPKRLLDKRP